MGPEIQNESYELVDVGALTSHPDNPNQGDVGAIVGSMEANGVYGALVVQKPRGSRKRGRILAGNHRWLAAKAAGVERVPVVWVDVDDERATRIMLADNQTANLATYDEAGLAALLERLSETDEGLAGTAFDDDDLDDLLGRLAEPPSGPQPGDDDFPDAVPAKTIPGDVWLLGPHRLLCGDATVPTNMDRLMAGGAADMVWTDPPYGVSYVGRTDDALTIKNDEATGLGALLGAALPNAATACRAGAAWYVAAPAGPQFLDFATVLTNLDIWRQTLVWLKNSLVLGRSDYHYRHEALFYGWVPGAVHSALPDRTHDSVLEFDRPARSEEHPTMKPVTLIAYCVENSTKPGDVVLDPFGGSGSTLVAAERLNREARLIELDPIYCDVICARYQKTTGDKPVAESTGNTHDFVTDE